MAVSLQGHSEDAVSVPSRPGQTRLRVRPGLWARPMPVKFGSQAAVLSGTGVSAEASGEAIDATPEIGAGTRVVATPECPDCPSGSGSSPMVGVVEMVLTDTFGPGSVLVLWEDGTIQHRRVGLAGKHEVRPLEGRDESAPRGFLPSLPVDAVEAVSRNPLRGLEVGARVVRGPDWKWGNQDRGGEGTVTWMTSLYTDTPGWVGVRWAHSQEKNYRMGYDGKYDLKVVDGSAEVNPVASSVAEDSAESRTSSTVDGPAPPRRKFKVGDRVVPTPECSDCRKGSGSSPVIGEIKAIDFLGISGTAVVEWPGGVAALEDVGRLGVYDIRLYSEDPVAGTVSTIITTTDGDRFESDEDSGPRSTTSIPPPTTTSPPPPPPPSPPSTQQPTPATASRSEFGAHGPRKARRPDVKVCSRVVRGRDWDWGDQDGSPPGEGRVVRVSNMGWVTVEWASGTEDVYRMGAEGKEDLRVLDDGDAVPPTFTGKHCGPKP